MALPAKRAAQLRRFTRHEVHIAVRFESAVEFVDQYAENLSRGGLFVRGAHELESGSTLEVELDLPGVGSYRARARVCHILPPEVAAEVGRSPGAGLELIDLPEEFELAMRGYLMRLGRRRDYVVMADSDAARRLFDDAGYSTEELPCPGDLVTAVARSEKTVAAVVVTEVDARAYKALADAAGADDLVLSYRDGLCLRDLLSTIDDRI